MKEKQFHKAVADYLANRRYLKKDIQYCHIPAETPLGLRSEQMEKRRMGVTKGAPDFVIWTRYGTLCLELKAKNGRQSKDQKQFEATLTGLGQAYIVINALDTLEQSVPLVAQTLDDFIINAALSLSD